MDSLKGEAGVPPLLRGIRVVPPRPELACECDGSGILATPGELHRWGFIACACVSRCARCGGDGFETISDEFTVRQTRCRDCYPKKHAVACLSHSRLPTRHPIDGGPKSPTQAIAMRRAIEWADGYEKDCGRGIILAGPTGSGKSFIGTWALRRLIQRRCPGRYIDTLDYLAEMKAAMGSKHDSPDAIEREMCQTQALMLDELPTALQTDWQRERVEYLLRARYDKSVGTIITTNLGYDRARQGESMWEGVARLVGGGVLGERIVSRLRQTCEVIELVGADIRGML